MDDSQTPAAKVINYGHKGVVVRKGSDVRKLTGAPDDFKQFMAGLITGALDNYGGDDCTEVAYTVGRYDPKGFALGDVFDCGGGIVIWGKKHGLWQQLWGGQALAECAELKSAGIPPSVVPEDDTGKPVCGDADGNKVPYEG